MLRIYWTVMTVLTLGGIALVLTAHSNLQLAGGLIALTLGAGGLSAATHSVSSDRRSKRPARRSRTAVHDQQ
jgi:hypothetical protein